MRFVSIGGSNAASYAGAGKATADSAAKMFAVQRKTGPDYGELSKTVMVTASQEKISAMKASTAVTNAATKAYSDVVKTGNAVEVFNKKNEIKANQRKAGGIAAIGKMAGAGFLAASDPTKGRERPKADFKSVNSTYKEQRDKLLESHRRESDAHGTFSFPDYKPATGGGSGKVAGGGSETSPTSGTPTSGIRSQAFNYLTKDKGLSRNKALGIIANVDRESGWDPKIRSGDDGGPGGLFQWKGSRQTPTVRKLVESGDWKGQLDHALNEPGEPYSQTYQQTTFDSPLAAADGWMTHFERPADTKSGSKKHTDLLSGYNF